MKTKYVLNQIKSAVNKLNRIIGHNTTPYKVQQWAIIARTQLMELYPELMKGENK